MRPMETQPVIRPEKTMDMSRMDRKTTLRELLKSRARYLNEMESAKRQTKRDAAPRSKTLKTVLYHLLGSRQALEWRRMAPRRVDRRRRRFESSL